MIGVAEEYSDPLLGMLEEFIQFTKVKLIWRLPIKIKLNGIYIK